jgi:FecR protein
MLRPISTKIIVGMGPGDGEPASASVADGGSSNVSEAKLGTAGDSNRHSGSKLHILPIVVASILLFGGVELAWSEEQVGGAHTVINHVEGNLATGNQVPVVQGDNVFLNEAVRSGADSKANLVLNDNTNVTVGPDSTIKLDDFVYSGPKQPGTIALNMTKGTLRFITGDANKRAYTIYTPTAAIGVRGTILRIQATPTETKVINEEGTAIVCLRKQNEYVSAEELRRRHCSKEQRKKGLCGCEELLVPNQEATISQSQIAVTEAPVGAISEPIIAEGFAGGFIAAPLGAAALVGAAAAAGAIGGATTSNGPTPVSPLSP